MNLETRTLLADLLKELRSTNKFNKEQEHKIWEASYALASQHLNISETEDETVVSERVSALFRKINSNIHKKEYEFYRNIQDDHLRNTLIDDFRHMEFEKIVNNVPEFGKYGALQLENIFNYF